MGLDIGGYEQKPDWPKMGPSLLIAACVILAIRTAKWSTKLTGTASDRDLDDEADHAIHVAGRVLSRLVAHHEDIFPSRREAWFVPSGEDSPK